MSALSFAPRARLALCLAAALVAGCDRSGDAPATGLAAAEQALGERLAVLPRLREARDVAHAGTRRVELYERSGDDARYLAYRERVASDGAGAFALEPVEPLTDVAGGWSSFALVQRQRAKFLVRYRDFAVRDEALFLRNYRLYDRGPAAPVAGRACEHLSVRRADGSHGYELALDEETGLLLDAIELDGEGRVLSRVTYESLELRPDLSSVVFHRSTIEEVDHALDLALRESFQAPLLEPRLLPQGYELRQASTLLDDQDQRWAKLVYTDGVETLFFAQALRDERAAALPPLPEGDELLVLQQGAVTMASGNIRGERLVLAGKVGSRALLDLVESSLP